MSVEGKWVTGACGENICEESRLLESCMIVIVFEVWSTNSSIASHRSYILILFRILCIASVILLVLAVLVSRLELFRFLSASGIIGRTLESSEATSLLGVTSKRNGIRPYLSGEPKPPIIWASFSTRRIFSCAISRAYFFVSYSRQCKHQEQN